MSSISIEEKLNERIKELVCLYETTHIINQKNTTIESTLTKIGESLKKALKHSDEAIIEITFNELEIFTDILPEKTIHIESKTYIENNNVGIIRIHYPSPKLSITNFLEEENKLLEKISSETSLFLERKERKEKEAKLKQSAERNDRLSILGEITAGIAHELNTPLGNILGFAELIKRENKVKTIDKDISKIINAAIYSREIVKKLMFFSCEMPQNKEILLIKPIIKQAVTLLGPNFKRANITCNVTFKDSTIKAQIDEIQLTQVLFNIIMNAIYVSPFESKIDILVYSKKENFIIEVKDEGSGIDEAIKSKIFEPFFTTKPIGEGSGLGLSVVHGIIKSHKGEIKVINNIPTGTNFQIILPLKEK